MTSDDKHLLELAAKAADIPERVVGAPGGMYNCDERGWHRNWNPFNDDGDALRLAVKLQFTVLPGIARDGEGRAYFESNNDTFAATRRAIVRAAAEIGKAMP